MTMRRRKKTLAFSPLLWWGALRFSYQYRKPNWRHK